MSQNLFRCRNCPERHFSTLLEAVQHVMSERGASKYVQCCVGDCNKTVRDRKLRLHIRKNHKNYCPWQCSACLAKFVEQRDLNNHKRNGCRRGLPSPPKASLRNKRPTISVRLKSEDMIIETFLEDVDFSNSSKVNDFISKDLQLNKASRSGHSRVVAILCECLQPSFSINKLVKGGSVGKGTAVKDKADIDCVVFLNDVKTMEQHKSNLEETKNRLESCLKRSAYRDKITLEKQTPFAVKFKLRLDDLSTEFHIDLLPTFTTDMTEQSRKQLYNEMIDCATEDKAFYSAHFVSSQVEFVEGQRPNVKDLIRLVKYWRKTCIEEKRSVTTRLPSSYPLELITIACWEEAGKPSSFDIRAGFKAVLQRLVNNCDIYFIWCKYYDKATAERGIKGMESKSLPFVLDPANPTNNVCSASNAEGWKTVADVAKTTLGRQPLKDIIVNEKWK